MSSATLDAAWFAPPFVAEVSLAQRQAAPPSLTANLGAFVRAVPEGGANFRVEYERGFIPAQLALDPGGHIVGLLFQAPQLGGRTLDGALAPFRALPGRASVLVTEGATERASLDANARLAVGSACKLAVLAELQAQVLAGTRRRDEVVALTDADRSLPSGFLQTWPGGSRITLETLATVMVSPSDNTATDVPLRVVGRPGVEKRLGQRAMPSPREFFAPKNPANAALKRRSLNGDEAEKRAILAAARTAPLPGPAVFAGDPVSPEIEWFASVKILCRLIGQTAKTARPTACRRRGTTRPPSTKRASRPCTAACSRRGGDPRGSWPPDPRSNHDADQEAKKHCLVSAGSVRLSRRLWARVARRHSRFSGRGGRWGGCYNLRSTGRHLPVNEEE